MSTREKLEAFAVLTLINSRACYNTLSVADAAHATCLSERIVRRALRALRKQGLVALRRGHFPGWVTAIPSDYTMARTRTASSQQLASALARLLSYRAK